VLLDNVHRMSQEFGFYDKDRSKGRLVAKLSRVKDDGTVELWKGELESALWCCGMLDEARRFVPSPHHSDYESFYKSLIPAGHYMDPYFFMIRRNGEYV